jgi:hypothetical protein
MSNRRVPGPPWAAPTSPVRTSRLRDVWDLVDEARQRAIRWAATWATAFRTRRLIVFLTPGWDLRSGGVHAIALSFGATKALKALHGWRVAMCAVPGDAFFLKYTWFKNRNYILDLESLLRRCGRLDHLLLHIPEYAVHYVLVWLRAVPTGLLSDIGEIHFNVMIQNIDLLQGPQVRELLRFGTVTCTTAHESYTNQKVRDMVGVPLHRLGVLTGPENYPVSPYRAKEQLMIVSNDPHPRKEEVLQAIAKAFPRLRIQIIQDISYEEFHRVIRRAKWGLTFGEGLDGYFAEPVLCGGVSFAVYNTRFFTPAFAALETVYPSWDVLLERMIDDMRRLDEPVAYERAWRAEYALFQEDTPARFRENLKRFHLGEYTFP